MIKTFPTRDKSPEPKVKFPRLMTNPIGDIILMTDKRSGTVVHGCSQTIGWHSTNWIYGGLEDWYGTLSLSSE